MAEQSEDQRPEPSALKILVPHVEVPLVSGAKVVVKPWGFLDTELFMSRLQRLATIAEAHPEAEAADLVKLFVGEIGGIVQDTIKYTDEQMADLTMEDGLELARVVVETSILRPDGGGVLGKMLSLRAYSRLLLAQKPAATTEPDTEVETPPLDTP